MDTITLYAKFWVGGFGAAITAYLGTWTDDPRILGVAALVTAAATFFVPNKTPELPPPSADDLAQPNFD